MTEVLQDCKFYREVQKHLAHDSPVAGKLKGHAKISLVGQYPQQYIPF